ncbi:hypothetical protein Tco_1486910 [Tanacetum coccineum]
MSWGWHKILQLQDLVRPFFWMQLGNGSKASLWHDMWSYECTLSSFLSARDITREGYSLQACVADLIHNGTWNWPSAWLTKASNIGLIATHYLDSSQQDTMRWCDLNGNLSDFAMECAWEVLRPHGQQVTWHHIPWFS